MDRDEIESKENVFGNRKSLSTGGFARNSPKFFNFKNVITGNNHTSPTNLKPIEECLLIHVDSLNNGHFIDRVEDTGSSAKVELIDLIYIVLDKLTSIIKLQISDEVIAKHPLMNDEAERRSPVAVMHHVVELINTVLIERFEREKAYAEVNQRKEDEVVKRYEALLQKAEADLRNHIRSEQQLKLIIDTNLAKAEENDKLRHLEISRLQKEVEVIKGSFKSLQEEVDGYKKTINSLQNLLVKAEDLAPTVNAKNDVFRSPSTEPQSHAHIPKVKSHITKRQSQDFDGAGHESILIPYIDLDTLIEVCRTTATPAEQKIRYIEQELCWFREMRRSKDGNEVALASSNHTREKIAETLKIYGAEKLASKNSFSFGQHRRPVRRNTNSSHLSEVTRTSDNLRAMGLLEQDPISLRYPTIEQNPIDITIVRENPLHESTDRHKFTLNLGKVTKPTCKTRSGTVLMGWNERPIYQTQNSFMQDVENNFKQIIALEHSRELSSKFPKAIEVVSFKIRFQDSHIIERLEAHFP
eukprot:TRINITY_DN669_c0_g2_i8.p1 TRINITY_DN669_c0_g2~~TRINITY_DN669_c0_g2_i8.p1  ORF type:complete len:527 (+),score=47.18 TRINITY_DN669_c0_g2_i8:78-1658(+)